MLREPITHVPDLVVNRLIDSKVEPPIMETYYGVLMSVDVSGIMTHCVIDWIRVCVRACVCVCVRVCL